MKKIVNVIVMMTFFLTSFAAPLVGRGDRKQVELKKGHPLAQVVPEKALIYVVRPAFVGTAIKTYFMCDDDFIGITRGKSYFYFYATPGKHVFWTKAENVDALELEVQEGQTYYLKEKIQMGALKARIKLVVLSEYEGKGALNDCKHFAVPTEKGKEKGQEIAVKYKENTIKDLDRRARKGH